MSTDAAIRAEAERRHPYGWEEVTERRAFTMGAQWERAQTTEVMVLRAAAEITERRHPQSDIAATLRFDADLIEAEHRIAHEEH